MSTKTRQNSSLKGKPTIGMLCDLAGFIVDVLSRLSFEQVENLLKNKSTILRQKLAEVFQIALLVVGVDMQVAEEWQKFYKDHFGLDVDFSEVSIPTKPTEGSWRLLFIPTGLALNTTLATMRELFKVCVYIEDPDKNVSNSTRTSVKSYAIWVWDGLEPDERYLGKSTRWADMAGTIGMTLLERLVMGTKYFTLTGKHLDEKGVTLCTGSRSADGYVPRVCWDPDPSMVSVY